MDKKVQYIRNLPVNKTKNIDNSCNESIKIRGRKNMKREPRIIDQKLVFQSRIKINLGMQHQPTRIQIFREQLDRLLPLRYLIRHHQSCKAKNNEKDRSNFSYPIFGLRHGEIIKQLRFYSRAEMSIRSTG